ncbi:MAG: hypothetical protein CFE26_22850, partial [Verrucomicrobiales bacterium VVV1]
NIIKSLYPQYLEQKRRLDQLKTQGLGESHPTIQAETQNLANMRKQLEEGVTSLRETLMAQLDMATERYAKMKLNADQKNVTAIDKSVDAVDYLDAQRELATAQEMLNTMKTKLIGETIQERIPTNSIIVHEDPVISQNPVSPNVTLNLMLGAVVGLIFGVGIAFFLEYLDTSVKTLEDVERYLQVPVLAVVPKDVGILH